MSNKLSNKIPVSRYSMRDANDHRPEILFIDDSKTARKTAEKILADKFTVHQAINGKDAWEQLEKNPDFDVVFADIQMPEMNGLQLLQKIRTSPDRRIAQKPVIMITGHSDSHAAMRAVFDMGATGFISKPFSDIDLMSCAYSYITLNQRLNHLEEKLGIDRQSGLYNAARFEDEGNKVLSMALRHKLELSIVYIEIKSLSDISNNHSNKIASQVVIEVAKRIQKHLREEEVIARVGASKFALLLPATSSSKSKIAISRVQNMIKSMKFITKNNQIRVDIAAGISSIGLNDNALDFNEHCKRANTVLQVAINTNSEMVLSYYDDADLDTDKTVQPDDVLSKSLPHIINGNFHKVTDEHLSYMMGILKPFMKYAAVKTGTS